ncbi:MAG: dioxygenase [Pseudomonadales bacterium]|nr:dioxygenase [Pseudomonadales bacterium]
MTRQPVIFVSHGAPTLAAHPGRVGQAWRDLAQSLPRPDAIVVISAHWQRQGLAITSAQQPGQIFDFYGFPDHLYHLSYTPAGAPKLASAITQRIEEYGISCKLDAGRGFDHGVWVPLLSMYPEADVPVLALSLLTDNQPHAHLRVGEALAALSDLNILVLGSGGLTHNLGYFGQVAEDGPALPFVQTFRHWMLDRLRSGQHEALLDYQHQAPDAARNHPTHEHLLPLFVCLGAAGPGSHAEVIDLGVHYGMLAMDAVVLTQEIM